MSSGGAIDVSSLIRRLGITGGGFDPLLAGAAGIGVYSLGDLASFVGVPRPRRFMFGTEFTSAGAGLRASIQVRANAISGGIVIEGFGIGSSTVGTSGNGARIGVGAPFNGGTAFPGLSIGNGEPILATAETASGAALGDPVLIAYFDWSGSQQSANGWLGPTLEAGIYVPPRQAFRVQANNVGVQTLRFVCWGTELQGVQRDPPL